MHVLLIIVLWKDWKFGKQILIFSQFLFILNLLLTHVLVLLKLKIKHQKKQKKPEKSSWKSIFLREVHIWKNESFAEIYRTNQESLVQEENRSLVGEVKSEFWLRKTFLKISFLSNMPDKRCRVFIDKESLDKPPEHSADIFQYNIFDCCIYEPHIFEIRKLGYTDVLFL